MGLADRDYARTTPPSNFGGLRPGGISFNTWLIIINVVAFLLANAMPMVWAPMGKGRVTSWPAPPNFDALVLETGGFPSQIVRDREAPARWVDPARNMRVVLEGFDGPSVTMPSWAARRWLLVDPTYSSTADAKAGEPVLESRKAPMDPLQEWGHFSTAKSFFAVQVWRFVTFQFLHADFSHILFNMIGLYFFGPLVERALGSGRRYLAYYLTCGIFGAVLYLILNLLGYIAQLMQLSIPGFLINDVYMPLIGASAGVFGVLMAAAYIAGDDIMYAFMILPMKIRTGAYLLTGLAIVNLFVNGENAGGDAAHVGGALAGYFFIRRSHLLDDFFDIFGGPSSQRRPKRKKKRKTEQRDTARLDAILDKVREQGVHSLTERERKFLDQMSEGKGGE